MARRGFTPTHDRGPVLVDVAVLIAGGGEAIADIDVLRHQSEVLGPVASAPTVWRTLSKMTPAMVKRVDTARARVRAHVWSSSRAAVACRLEHPRIAQVVVVSNHAVPRGRWRSSTRCR